MQDDMTDETIALGTIGDRLIIPPFLYASNLVLRKGHFRYLSADIREVSPLAEGYALFSQTSKMDAETLHGVLTPIVSAGKSVVLTDVNSTVMSVVADLSSQSQDMRIVEVFGTSIHELTPRKIKRVRHFEDSVVFLLSDRFLLRRYLHQRAQRSNVVFAGQEHLPTQRVHFVGLGPSPDLVTQAAHDNIKRASHVIVFDRTLANILPNQHFARERFVITYDYEDFSRNLLSLNLALAAFQAAGCYDVTVCIEGNPEIYDFAEGLSTVARQFAFEVAVPLVVLGCQWLEHEYGLDFMAPSYVLTSGFNARQGVTTLQATQEIASYLSTDLTCMAMEMYLGDLPLVLRQVQKSPRPKSVLVLTNMYSPQQHVFFLPFEDLNALEWVQSIKGRFTTLIIIDDQRLPIGSPLYLRLCSELGPHADSI